MIALFDDTITEFIGEIVFQLHAIWQTYCLESTGRSYTFLLMYFSISPLMDITIQQLPYNITNIIKGRN